MKTQTNFIQFLSEARNRTAKGANAMRGILDRRLQSATLDGDFGPRGWNPFISRFVAGVLIMTVPMMSLPLWAFAPDGKKAKSLDSATLNPVQPTKTKPMAVSRELTAKELRTLCGKTTGMVDANPYVAGTNKWDVVHNGINLITGNFTTSATDLSFEGGYGIPVNLTRSYSVNNPDEGPFGWGWTMSCDIRSTAGGILKSSSAPIRSVPVNFKERPKGQDDPAVTVEPVEAVVTTDAAGAETTVSRDVDGILTTPPWDKNEIENEYELVTVTINNITKTYEILKSSKVTTPEGTVYVYQKHGYAASQYSVNNPGGTTAPTNILKIQTVTDRHGNPTYYTYNGGTATFTKYNGDVVEDKLTKIEMPGGREINFVWSQYTVGSATLDRVSSINDGTRTVNYEYSYVDQNTNTTIVTGLLQKAKTPENRATTYSYGGVIGTESGGVAAQGEFPTSLLKTITDPRGLTTEVSYVVSNNVLVHPYGVPVRAIAAYQIKLPNNIVTMLRAFGNSTVWPSPYNFRGGDHGYTTYCDRIGGDGGALVEDGQCRVQSVGNGTLWVRGGTGGADVDAFPITWSKYFDIETYNCTSEARGLNLQNAEFSVVGRHFNAAGGNQTVSSTTEYNCFGNPLSKTVVEDNYPNTSLNRTQMADYAYWGAEKYYQLRTVRTKYGTGTNDYRYSFTDYYGRDATDGSKGQTKRVWGPNTFGTPQVTSESVPAGTDDPDDLWKYRTYPQYFGNTSVVRENCSAEFAYDSDGRPTDVHKLQTISGSTYNYVQTHTTYLGNGAGAFGLPGNVVEAYGTSNARTTTTNEYDPIGRATVVTDAAGRTFTTTYNLDGQILSVYKTAGVGTNGPIVFYSYGAPVAPDTTSIDNGMVTSVYDLRTAYKETVSYYPNSSYDPPGNDPPHCGRVGQVQQVTEKNTSIDPEDQHSIVYDYTAVGERESALYTKFNEFYGDQATKWKYSDYTFVGYVGDIKRVFQTLNKQKFENNAWTDSTEEFHYNYDPSGRLTHTAFAQFPDYNSNESPQTSTIYSEARPAQKRIVQENSYDAAGRATRIATYWQNQNDSGPGGGASGFYLGTPIYSNAPGYSAVLGLKTNSGNTHFATDFVTWQPGGNGNPALPVAVSGWDWNEVYSYDSQLDYLTGVDYNDARSNEVWNWTYDVAGNRITDSVQGNTWTYDNLNRMTASPGMTYINDTVGNRTSRNYNNYYSSTARVYKWDVLNRMTSTIGTAQNSGSGYTYRADGMRMKKVDGVYLSFVEDPDGEEKGSGYYDENHTQNYPTTRYFYDGQMCIEDEYTGTSGITASRYGLGARGIDYIEKTTGINGTFDGCQFPVYDAHGNMVLTISRTGTSSSSPGYSSANRRSFDVWGSVRASQNLGTPTNKQRYCANLGHVEDDESGLIYMRARYYEPWTGRFVSEDNARQPINWYVYGLNRPTMLADPDGCDTLDTSKLIFMLGIMFAFIAGAAAEANEMTTGLLFAGMAVMAFALMFANENIFGDGTDMGYGPAGANVLANGIGFIGYFAVKLVYKSAPAWLKGILGTTLAGVKVGSKDRRAALAVNAVATYTYILCGAMIAMEMLDGDGL